MSAAWSVDESIANNVRRTLVERLVYTREELERQPLSDESVHAIRKELKRARAGLRLLRDAMGVAEYRRLNRALRDAARPLSLMRDASVLLQALDQVTDKMGKLSQLPLASELRSALRQELCFSHTQLEARDIAAIRRRLSMVTRRLQRMPAASLDQASVAAAIKRAHKKVRKAFKAAKRQPNDENLHEWRKQVKYEANQWELLLPLKPKRIGTLIRNAKKLGDHLGDDHDLAVLELKIGEKKAGHEAIAGQTLRANTADAIENADALSKTLTRMRAKLQRKAYRVGESLHAGKFAWKLVKQ